MVLANVLLDWGPIAELGDGGVERWIAYPAVLWLAVYGGYLMGGREPETHGRGSDPLPAGRSRSTTDAAVPVQRAMCWRVPARSARSRLVIAVTAVLALSAGCLGREGQRHDGPAVPVVPLAVVSETALSERVHDLRVSSPALGRTASVRLLLPSRYDAQPHRRWPVLYLLHGCCDDYGSWTRSTDVVQLTASSDLLVVLPEGGRAGFYSDWVAGPGWETFHLVELRQILEQRYRAGTSRAIAGLSMGGLGALCYAARHPGLFRAAASFSGIVHTRLSAGRSERYRQLVRLEGEEPDDLWGRPDRQPEVWAAHNPYDLAPKLRGTALFVSVGDGRPGPYDPPGADLDETEAALAGENAALADRLRALGIPAWIDFYGPGTHTWPYWQRELRRAWPMLRRELGLR